MTQAVTEHQAKTAALLAYAEDLLSAEGRRRLEAHLGGCEVCRRELAAIELYERMAQDVRALEVPEVDFAKMELALAREANRVSGEIRVAKRRRGVLPWGVAVAAAAALVAVYVARSPSSAEPSHAPTASDTVAAGEPNGPAPSEAPGEEAPIPLRPIVTLAAGTVERLDEGDAQPLEPGAELAAGDRIRTGEDSRAHVRLDEGTGFALAQATELELVEVSAEAVALRLARGEAASAVAPLRSGSSYVILAAEYRVEVTGTRFVVSYLDDVLAVDVAEGEVTVHGPGDTRRVLSAPARWSSAGGPSGQPTGIEVRGIEVRGIEARTEDEALTPLTLTHPELVRWAIDGTTVESAQPVRLQVRDGEHRLEAWTAQNRRYEATFQAGGAPLTLDEGVLTPSTPPRMRAGHLEPRVIAGVVRGGMRSLSQCYERSLRGGAPAILGHPRLRVTVGTLGDVSRVQVRGLEGEGASELRACIVNYVQRWEFPPPGGPVTFEQPIQLAPTM